MAGNLKVEIRYPVTQTIDSGNALAKFLGLSEELPEKIALANDAALVLSTKRDAYYVVTLQSCTCMAGQYNKIGRHRRDLTQATREAQAPKPLLQEMKDEGYEMSFEPDPNYDTRAKPEPRLELFGSAHFKPVLPGE